MNNNNKRPSRTKVSTRTKKVPRSLKSVKNTSNGISRKKSQKTSSTHILGGL